MANIPLKTIKFPGLDDTYTVPQVDSTLSVSGQSADAKVTGDALKAKAEAEGAVSMAKALVGGKYTSDKQPYHFRKSPSGGAKDEVIVGGSLRWNQLAQISDYETTTNNGVTYTNNEDGSITVNGTATALSFITHSYYLNQNHVYYWHICPSNGSSSTYFGDTGASLGRDYGNGCVGKYTGTSETRYFRLYVQNGVTVSNLKVYPQLIDLTLLFGSTIADYIYSLEQASAGAGVAWVKRYIDLDTYHDYDAGSIKSVEGLESHDVVVFNQFDENNLTVGYYLRPNDGRPTVDANSICSADFSPCLPNTTYHLHCGNTSKSQYVYLFLYDAEHNFVDYWSFTGAGERNLTMPSNVAYFKASMYGYGTTYNHDICINLSDPSRNGTYEPYEKHSYPLDSSLTLRGVPKLVTDHIEFDGDRYSSDGTVTRIYREDDFKDLDWTYNGTRFAATLTAISQSNSRFKGLCSKYEAVNSTVANAPDKSCIFGVGSDIAVYIKDSSFTDVATFKQSMTGQTIMYLLATPTTESAQPYQSPQLAGSTEEYVTTGVVPVGHESRYYEDITGKVNNLPSDFSTLIAPVEKSFTATRNYTVGSFVIVNNQLYKVTSAISSGGTITPNSNVTATTIMAEILALA